MIPTKEIVQRKKLERERDIVPILNQIAEVILYLGVLERGYKDISTSAIKEAKKLSYKLKNYIDNSLQRGYKTPKEYKQVLKLYKEEKLYTCTLFRNVA